MQAQKKIVSLESYKPKSSILSFDEYAVLNTGKFISPSRYAKSTYNDNRLKEQSIDLAKRLEPKLLQYGYKPLLSKSDKVMKTLITRQIIEVPEFSNTNFLPYQAKKNRNQFLLSLEHFIENEAPADWRGNTYLRYGVLTFGQRVTLKELPRRMDEAKENVSRWIEEARKKYNTEFYFVGWEYTINEDKTFHWHANILYQNPVSDTEIQKEFTKWSDNFISGTFEDCGRIENIQEMVKYPFKPAEMDHLNDKELFKLYRFCFRRRFFEKLGHFREYSSRNKHLRYGRVNGIVVTREPNCLFSPEQEKESLEKETEQDKKDPKNILLCTVAPSFSFGMWSEPAVLIWNYEPNAMGEAAQSRLDYIEHIAQPYRDEWKRKGCPDPRTAVAVSKAALDAGLDGEKAKSNVRALWDSSDPYGVHNGTISPEIQKEYNYDDLFEVIDHGFEIPPPEIDEVATSQPYNFLSIFQMEPNE